MLCHGIVLPRPDVLNRVRHGIDDRLGTRLSQTHHGRWQKLGDPADLRGDDIQTGACRFNDRRAKGLGQGGIEKQLPTRKMRPNIALSDRAHQFDAVLQHVPLTHLLQLDILGSIATNHESHVRVLLT